MSLNVSGNYSAEAESCKEAGNKIKIIKVRVYSNAYSSLEDIDPDDISLLETDNIRMNDRHVVMALVKNDNANGDYVVKTVVYLFDKDEAATVLTWGSDSNGLVIPAGESRTLAFNADDDYKVLFKVEEQGQGGGGGSDYPEATASDMSYASPSTSYKIVKPSQIKNMIDSATPPQPVGSSPSLNLRKVNLYTYEIDYESLDEAQEYSHNYYLTKYQDFPEVGSIVIPDVIDENADFVTNASRITEPDRGACTGVRKGNYYGRNFDWYYNESAFFVIRTKASQGRYATLGMAGNVAGLTRAFVESREYSDAYKLLPYHLLDGINEKGVVCSINVVGVGDHGITRGTNSNSANRMCILEVPRYILDHCATAAEAVSAMQSNMDIFGVYCNELNYKEEIHLMVADANETYIVEFIAPDSSSATYGTDDTEIVVTKVSGSNVTSGFNNRSFMTNFIVSGSSMSGNELDYDSVNATNCLGLGLERYESIYQAQSMITSMDAMMVLMDQALRYSHAYDYSNFCWYSELCGIYEVEGVDPFSVRVSTAKAIKGKTDITELPETIQEILRIMTDKYEHRSRDPESEYYGTWHTSYSSVYDIANKKFRLRTQEGELEESVDGSHDNINYASINNALHAGNILNSTVFLGDYPHSPDYNFNFQHYYTAAEVDSLVGQGGGSAADDAVYSEESYTPGQGISQLGVQETLKNALGMHYDNYYQLKQVKIDTIEGAIDITQLWNKVHTDQECDFAVYYNLDTPDGTYHSYESGSWLLGDGQVVDFTVNDYNEINAITLPDGTVQGWIYDSDADEVTELRISPEQQIMIIVGYSN